EPGLLDWSLLVFLTVLAAPFWEELLFRGVFQGWLCRRAWGGDGAMLGGVGVGVLGGARPLDEAFRVGDPGRIFLELGLSLFVLALLPGFFWIDRVAPRLLRQPARRSLISEESLAIHPTPSDLASVTPRLGSTDDNWYLTRVTGPAGPTPVNIARGLYGT